MNDHQQHPAIAEINAMAEEDAGSDVRKIRWVFIGFFGNILGILIASVYEPTPPASRLLDKSPEYTAFYTDSYKIHSRSVQVRHSLIGLALAFALIFLWTVLSS